MSPASSTSGDSVIMGAGFGDTTKGIMRKPSSGNADTNTKRKKSKRFSKVKSIFRRSKKSSSSSKLSSDKHDITEYGLEPTASGETEATSRTAASLGFESPNNDITILTDNGGQGSISVLHATFSEDIEDDSPLSISLPLINEPFNAAFENSFNNADTSVDIRELSSITVVSTINESLQEEEGEDSEEAEYSPAPLLLDISVDDTSVNEDGLLFDGDILESLVKEVEEVVEDAIKGVDMTQDASDDTKATPVSTEVETNPLEVETLVKVVEEVVEEAIAGIEQEEAPVTETSMIFESDEADISLEVVAPASCRSQLLDMIDFVADEYPEDDEVAVYSGVSELLKAESALESLDCRKEKEIAVYSGVTEMLKASPVHESLDEETELAVYPGVYEVLYQKEEYVTLKEEDLAPLSLETPSVADEVNMSMEVEAPISCRSELLNFDSASASEHEPEDIAIPSIVAPSSEASETMSDSVMVVPPASPTPETPRLDEILKGGDYEVEFTAAIILDETPVKQERAVVPRRRKVRAVMVKKIKQKGGKGLVAIVVTVVCFAVCLGNVSWKAARASEKNAKLSTPSGASIFPPKEAANKPVPLLTETGSDDVDAPSTPPKVRKLLSSNYGPIEFPQSVKDTTQSQLEKMRPPQVDKDNVIFWFV